MSEYIRHLSGDKALKKIIREFGPIVLKRRRQVYLRLCESIQSSMARLYGLNRKHKRFKKQMLAIAGRWSPYRTYACIYLWRWKG